MNSSMLSRHDQINLPGNYWSRLSKEDQVEFHTLCLHFHQSQKVPSKDRRLVSFSNELATILKYIEHSETNREIRTILCGVAFGGPFICVNTRQLKNFLGRCKSSINGSFQQLGYVALRTKSKARSCVLSIIPSLINDQNILRQWTVRCACDTAMFCFVTSIPNLHLPEITDEDLNDDHHTRPVITSSTTFTSSFEDPYRRVLPSEIPSRSFSSNLTNFQITDASLEISSDSSWNQPGDLTTSFSVDTFSSLKDGWEDQSIDDDWESSFENHSMKKSQSTLFDNNRSQFGDFSLFSIL